MLNEVAVAVIKRIENKLQGRDFNESEQLSV